MGYIEELRALVGTRPVILVGVKVLVINEENEVLLQLRKNGLWAIPGGLMELGESTEETGRREVFEETGLHIGAMKLIGVYSGKDQFLKLDNGDEFYAVTVAYTTKEITGGALAADGVEGTEVKFFKLSHLPDGFNANLRALILTDYIEGAGS
ncbi:NUDIX hydrolase [Cohnella cholangitidis]|uniref:NUDIX hydrolase n=1 Tax=Cohnella cholangitidis TaxID=2598458 RepID=A0A7G5BSU2_9BACL|nr:NUDIX hydrolase [Cohnella cholangitidis]QMV40026.1 NUDIX hydrolase [Cohnella cholangitidis]